MAYWMILHCLAPFLTQSASQTMRPILDTTGDQQLGGQDFVFSGDEPKLVFRDSVTLAWYAVNDQGNTPEEVRDINGNLIPNANFNMDPEVSTFGAANPTAIPEPSSILVCSLVSLIAFRRRR